MKRQERLWCWHSEKWGSQTNVSGSQKHDTGDISVKENEWGREKTHHHSELFRYEWVTVCNMCWNYTVKLALKHHFCADLSWGNGCCKTDNSAFRLSCTSSHRAAWLSLTFAPVLPQTGVHRWNEAHLQCISEWRTSLRSSNMSWMSRSKQFLLPHPFYFPFHLLSSSISSLLSSLLLFSLHLCLHAFLFPDSSLCFIFYLFI